MVTLFTTRRPDAEVRQHFNELRTIASIDQQVDDWHAAQPEPPAPVIIEHPIEPVLQRQSAPRRGNGNQSTMET
jgi:hypothetical protein